MAYKCDIFVVSHAILFPFEFVYSNRHLFIDYYRYFTKEQLRNFESNSRYNEQRLNINSMHELEIVSSQINVTFNHESIRGVTLQQNKKRYLFQLKINQFISSNMYSLGYNKYICIQYVFFCFGLGFSTFNICTDSKGVMCVCVV